MGMERHHISPRWKGRRGMNIADMPRLWDEENKKMYYPLPVDGTIGYYCRENLGDEPIMPNAAFEWVNDVQEGHKKLRYSFDRSTGLKDRYGGIIYEGDIIRNGEGTKYTISWNEYGYWQADTFAIAMCAKSLYSDYEVVGNVHQGVLK